MTRQVVFAKERTNSEIAGAMRVRAAYVEARSVFESRREGRAVPYSPPRQYDGKKAVRFRDDGADLVATKEAIWLRLWKWFQQHKITPELYFDVIFSDMPLTAKHQVEPASIAHDNRLTAYRRLLPKFEDEARSALRIQTIAARNQVTYRQLVENLDCDTAVAKTVDDMSIELSPLFRYCLAVSSGGPLAMAAGRRWRKEAKAQYDRYAGLYYRTWKSVLPATFAGGS
jgi:hypothetical protein